MSLAEEIVKRSTQASPNQEVDEFGIPVPAPETLEYLVARALCLNTQAIEGKPAIHGLHLRNGVVYKGHTSLTENDATIYNLTHLKRSLKAWEKAAFWRELKKHLPTLNRQFLEVAPDLYWDINKAELINHKEAEYRAKMA